MRAPTAWICSALAAFLVLGVSAIGLRKPRPMIDVRTTPRITHAGGLDSERPHGERFRCAQDGLERIDLLLSASAPAEGGRVTLKLRARSLGGPVLREQTITPGISPGAPAWARFDFEPVSDSAGAVFHLSIHPADERASALSPWVRFHGQTGENDAWGDRFLKAGATHRGDFVSDHALMRALAFPVESLSLDEGSASLTLFETPSHQDPIRSAALSSADEVRNGWAFFSFEPIPESRWKRYYFELRTPAGCRLIGTAGADGEAVPVYKTFHGEDDPSSPLLGMTRGAPKGSLERRDRDLVFRAWGDDPPEAVLARLEERTGGKLWLACLLWSLATAICLRLFVFTGGAVTETAPTD